jgi:hypothetical protein
MKRCGFTSNWREIRNASQRPQTMHGLKLAQIKPCTINYCPDWLFTKFPQITIGRIMNILNSGTLLDTYFRLA